MAPETTAYVVDVPVRYRKGVKIIKAFSDAEHLRERTAGVRWLQSVSRKNELTRR
jgi:hypothetical protein